MKKITLFVAFTLFIVANTFAQSKTKIDFPIGGSWYSTKTKQLFSFQADADGTIKGRGVYYGNGTGKLVQMQIMSQTTVAIESGQNAYVMLTYDTAKPKTIYKLVTYPGADGVVLKMTEPNNSKKAPVIFYNLSDVQPKVQHSEDN